jgi:ATP synthase I chain
VEPAVFTPVSAVANLRRSVVLSAVLGAASIVICAFAGHPLLGLFACLGLALGAANNWLLQRSVRRHASSAPTMDKTRFRNGVLGRLGGITLIAVAFGLLVHTDGLGVFAGLAVFQVLMLFGAAVPVFRGLRPTS